MITIENIVVDENMENENGKKKDKHDDGMESSDSRHSDSSVSVENPDDMSITVEKDKPPPVPNIPKFSFMIKKEDSLKELTREMLDSIDDENKKKQLIGERLFHRIKKSEGTNTSKVTGYILSLKVDVCFNLLSDDNDLAEKIKLAYDAIGKREKQTKEMVNEQMNKMRQDLSKDIGDNNNNNNNENSGAVIPIEDTVLK